MLASDLKEPIMERALIIKDLPFSDEEATLDREQMKRLTGGRAVQVRVDNNGVGTVDDWEINTAIFEGRIKGSYL
ncbi:hypothetical protein AWB81_01274 [Caballeronia arationis]|uniref:Uncharacterized protein n=2 Tax=Caballeronia arationis TaxID=1777142 RepID=A0A7Z7I4Y1_9BURK|nr:hypothetical protein AWB81_01274 [Caballeronia arationis]SOE61513.1 hypothetical protein SAMN05446927_2122 [Caballeronia arationis]